MLKKILIIIGLTSLLYSNAIAGMGYVVCEDGRKIGCLYNNNIISWEELVVREIPDMIFFKILKIEVKLVEGDEKVIVYFEYPERMIKDDSTDKRR